MTVADDIQSAVRSGNAIVGYRETIKFLKSGGPVKEVVMANNVPKDMDSEMRRDAEAGEARLEVFDGTSRDLGTACGKPFPVAAMVIKG